MKKLLSVVITLLLMALPVVGFVKRQAIFDWWKLRDYTPSARIVELANSTTLTDSGKHLFYVYHAELQGSEAFNTSCDFSEQSIVLGCYVSGQGIYIFDVKDERLKGIHEVTAAHEVLHAAYERLNTQERSRIDELTQQTFNQLENERIKKTVESYRERDPSIVANELHSILATEVDELPTELETHYAKYFTNRKAVVNYSKQYEQAFSERENRIKEIQQKLESLKNQIDANEKSLAQTKEDLAAQFSNLESQRSSTEANTFNARVRAYNGQVQRYNVQVQQSYALIDQHNALVAEYNKIVGEEKELIQAIDSRPETIETQ